MIHIGKIIKKKIKERGISITEFGRRINTHRRNVYDIFERESIDTALLYKISNVLEQNLFEYYIEKQAIIGTENQNKEILEEQIKNSLKEITYLKQIIIEKNKVIYFLESKNDTKKTNNLTYTL